MMKSGHLLEEMHLKILFYHNSMDPFSVKTHQVQI